MISECVHDCQWLIFPSIRNHLLLDSLINGEDISKRASINVRSRSKTKDTQEVFGETRYSPRGGSNNQRWDATQQVKEKVNNDAVKKSEFLKKLQELEQLEVRKKSKEEQEEVDGMIHFSENQFYKEEDSEHKNLQIIQKELLKVIKLLERSTTLHTHKVALIHYN